MQLPYYHSAPFAATGDKNFNFLLVKCWPLLFSQLVSWWWGDLDFEVLLDFLGKEQKTTHFEVLGVGGGAGQVLWGTYFLGGIGRLKSFEEGMIGRTSLILKIDTEH